MLLIVVLFISVSIVLQVLYIKIDFQIVNLKVMNLFYCGFGGFMDVCIVEFACAYWNGLLLFYMSVT